MLRRAGNGAPYSLLRARLGTEKRPFGQLGPFRRLGSAY